MVGTESVASVTLTSSGTAAAASVGGSPYAIVPSAAVAGAGTNLANYTITYANGSLMVNAKALTITATDRSKSYGDTATVAGTEFTRTAMVGSESVASVTLTSAGAAAAASVGAPYAIVPSAAVAGAGTNLANYTITYANGSLTVNAKALTITATDRSKSYGDAVTFAGTEFTRTAMVGTESVASVTLTSSGTAAAASVGGSPYAIVPSAAVAGAGTNLANYTITYANGRLTVNAKALTITATDGSKSYGDAVTFAATEFTCTAMVGTESVASVTLTSSGTAAAASVGGSPYAIVPSAAVAG